MATRYYTYSPGEYYHIYNRGNSRQVIFKSEQDFERFKKILYIANSPESFKLREFDEVDVFDIEHKEKLVHIGAYCLMPNHYHLLLTPAQEGGVPKFMLKLTTSYALYFNKKYDRVGALYEGPYRAKYADSDRYLKYLFAYIHLNPFRSKDSQPQTFFDVNRFLEYAHSSLPDYLGIERNEGRILDLKQFPEYFTTVQAHRRELFEWLDYGENVM
jgi:putative transposase